MHAHASASRRVGAEPSPAPLRLVSPLRWLLTSCCDRLAPADDGVGGSDELLEKGVRGSEGERRP